MKTIPIFFTAGDPSLTCLSAALISVKNRASMRYKYHIHILSYNLSSESVRALLSIEDRNFSISFAPVNEADVRDTLSMTKVISLLFPEYDKCICLHPGLVAREDISELWEEPLGRRLFGAVGGRIDSGAVLVNLREARQVNTSEVISAGNILWLDPCWDTVSDGAFGLYA